MNEATWKFCSRVSGIWNSAGGIFCQSVAILWEEKKIIAKTVWDICQVVAEVIIRKL